MQVANFFHPGAFWERRWVVDEKIPGQQCTYDETGQLITTGLAAGTPDSVGFLGFLTSPERFAGHTLFDFIPYLPGISFYWMGFRDNIFLEWYLENFPPNEGKGCAINTGPPQQGSFLDIIKGIVAFVVAFILILISPLLFITFGIYLLKTIIRRVR